MICAQNGVNNERVVLRRRARTFGMCLVLPATHLEPGVVIVHAAPVSGVLDVGRYPRGLDDTSERVAADLRDATFDARADAQVMRWKYAKLLGNLGNALDAACGLEGRQSHLYARARAEGEACCAAAGIEYAPPAEEEERRAVLAGPQMAGRGTTGAAPRGRAWLGAPAASKPIGSTGRWCCSAACTGCPPRSTRCCARWPIAWPATGCHRAPGRWTVSTTTCAGSRPNRRPAIRMRCRPDLRETHWLR